MYSWWLMCWCHVSQTFFWKAKHSTSFAEDLDSLHCIFSPNNPLRYIISILNEWHYAFKRRSCLRLYIMGCWKRWDLIVTFVNFLQYFGLLTCVLNLHFNALSMLSGDCLRRCPSVWKLHWVLVQSPWHSLLFLPFAKTTKQYSIIYLKACDL